ncbi:hypothetical protein FQA47_023502 [Oryzias melastigma]|uniref:Uncharacterized protein n=1 Tax=Oryzias melastigma TaxID=30732 RepID=A0A834FLT2_ORYME|nr:hypothetical protein FQA47_023502 [Oryzias melastigma]
MPVPASPYITILNRLLERLSPTGGSTTDTSGTCSLSQAYSKLLGSAGALISSSVLIAMLHIDGGTTFICFHPEWAPPLQQQPACDFTRLSLILHPPSPVITPACPPAGRLSRVLHQHQAGYKSHCIITAPRYALTLRPAHRAPPIGRRGSAVSLPARNVDSIAGPAFLPATADWGTGALLELSIRRFPVRLALNAAPCDALNAERRGALHTNRDAEQDSQTPSQSKTVK